MFIGSFGEEEEEEEKKEIDPRKGKVTFNFDSRLFVNNGESFSFRDNSVKQEEVLPQVKDWKQIAFDFLNEKNDYLDIGPNEYFDDLDTHRAEEFVVGQGATNWGEIRRKALEDSKEKKRRARK